MDNDTCRCGHRLDSTDPHPCHGDEYRCKKPAKQYFYNPTLPALAGMQMKVTVVDTWACEECWEAFKAVQRSMST